MEVTLDKWQKWVSALIEGDDCVVANLNSAADDLERNIKLQNEGKWGTEEGPPGLRPRLQVLPGTRSRGAARDGR